MNPTQSIELDQPKPGSVRTNQEPLANDAGKVSPELLARMDAYPSLIHRLTYRRTNHKKLHVRGFQEEGTTTTPFDMVVLNDMDRFHLVCDVIDRVPGLSERAAAVRQAMVDKRVEHKRYINEHGIDMPEILHWKWKC